MIYRNAIIQDLEKIVQIYNSIVASRLVTADTEPVTVESRIHWFHEHNPEKRPLWIVENDEHETIGWVSFQNFYGRPAYSATVEISIYLDEIQRGKGLGKAILQHIIQIAPTFGVNTILGFIFAHNEPSLKLFNNLGFEVWATFPNVALLDGIERSLKILGRRV